MPIAAYQFNDHWGDYIRWPDQPFRQIRLTSTSSSMTASWDEDRIKSLIASVSRAFPVGALMSLDTGGPVNFKPRPVEGAPPDAKNATPQSLLLDGQQRMTSLYQVTLRGKVVETETPKKKKVRRWFYIDIRKALDPSVDREEAIVGVPEDRIVRSDFGRKVDRHAEAPAASRVSRLNEFHVV
jgi:hypothetical protein